MLRRHDRRQFLQATSALVAAWHLPGHRSFGWGQDQQSASPRLLHLQLKCNKLEELRRFYQHTLGLQVHSDNAQGFTLQTGPSSIEWQPAPVKTEPFYHFAFNIPENQFAQAKAWLAKRTALLLDSVTGKDEVYFASWNAHAVYFRDPAGNIGELIARHTLKNSQAGQFGAEQLLCVSEIGLVATASRALSTELTQRLNWPVSGSELYFVGDGQGYLIVAPVGRAWLPDRIQLAMTAPVQVTVNQSLPQPISAQGDTYIVRGK